MTNKQRMIISIAAILTCFTLTLSQSSCKEKNDLSSLLENGNSSSTLSSSGLLLKHVNPPLGNIYPGHHINIYVYCEPEGTDRVPKKPVYVWDISLNDNPISQLIHDSAQKPNKDYDPINTYYNWPYGDKLLYQCTDAGTYTFLVSLYDYEEYVKDKSSAKVYATYTHNAYSEKIKISIITIPTENDREYELQAIIENPKHVPVYSLVDWHFTDESTGQADNGLTELVSFEDELYDKGLVKVTHQFEKSGKYKVLFTLKHNSNIESASTPDQIAHAETIIDITQSFEIITPAEPLKSGEEYTFTARMDTPESLPSNPSYEWLFGDGNGLVIPFSNEVTHIYAKEGTYTVSVKVFESNEEAAPLLGVANAEIKVETSANHLIELHEMKKFALDFAVQHDYVEGMSGRYSWDFESYGEVFWDGVYFSMQWEQYNHSEVMTGRVSEDGTVIEQLKIRHEFKDSDGKISWYELEIQNLPFWLDNIPDRFIVSISDEDVQNYVVYFNTYRTAGYQWTNDASLYVRFLN